jgi:hypothetical protein
VGKAKTTEATWNQPGPSTLIYLPLPIRGNVAGEEASFIVVVSRGKERRKQGWLSTNSMDFTAKTQDTLKRSEVNFRDKERGGVEGE